VASIVAVLLGGHDGDVVDERLQIVMIEILDQLLVEVFQLLQAVVVVKQLFDRAVLGIEQVLDGGAALASIAGPEIGTQEPTKV